MLTLYYSPGASSVIPHITLEEIRVPYQRKLINLAKGEHKTDAYLKINPHGKVPALCVDGNVLTENVAILTYLAKQFPDARLLPQNLLEEARCLSTMAWFAKRVGQVLDAMPVTWLVALQLYRVVGSIFLATGLRGVLPSVFALPAGIGDVLTGLFAVPAAL